MFLKLLNFTYSFFEGRAAFLPNTLIIIQTALFLLLPFVKKAFRDCQKLTDNFKKWFVPTYQATMYFELKTCRVNFLTHYNIYKTKS